MAKDEFFAITAKYVKIVNMMKKPMYIRRKIDTKIQVYLEFMNKTFVAYLAGPFFTNKLKEIVKQPKAYFFDAGFLNHILSYEVDSGKKLEQVAVMELIKAGFSIKYWRDKRDREMDFIVYKDNKIITAIEAKRGGERTASFNAFRKAYAAVAASVVTEETVFKTIDLVSRS